MEKDTLEHVTIRGILAKPEEKEFFKVRVAAHGRHHDSQCADSEYAPATIEVRRAAAVQCGIAQDLKRKLTAGIPATQQPYTQILRLAVEGLDFAAMAQVVTEECK